MREIDTLATSLIAAHRQHRRITAPLTSLTRPEILAVQARVSAALGPVAGFKVGQTPGEPPTLAPIPACYGVANGGKRPVRDRLGVELEVGFEVIRALPSARLPVRPQDYFRPRVVLELCDSRISGDIVDRLDLKFADLQLNAGLVLGDGPEHWDGSDFGKLNASLVTANKTVLAGSAQVPGGSALANLDLLISHLGDHCGGLALGHTVITGSLCGLPWFSPDAVVSGSIDGLGAASVSLCGWPDQASGKAQGQARPDP